MDKMRMESPDMTAQNIDKIAALFPNCITESIDAVGGVKRAINFDLLRQMLSGDVVEGDEAYEFTWVGKKAAIVEANKPIRKTLRPCPEESRDWNTTENLYIEGDNLEVLKLLQESYLGKVKMIYIDPPYNTGNDFIYRDDFAQSSDEYQEQMGMFDEETGDRLFKNTDSNGRFHSDWCSMIYSRLILARNLLAKGGVLAVSISYNELHNLMKICQEMFTNMQVFAVTVQTSGGKPNGAFNISNEYVVFAVPQEYDPVPTEEDMKAYSSPYHGMNLATFNQVQRPNQAYPIYVNKDGVLVGCGKSIQERINDGIYVGYAGDFIYDYDEAPEGAVAVWPVTAKGDQCVWRLIPSRLLSDWEKGYIKIVPQKSSSTKNAFAVQYLSGGIIDKIQSGALETYKFSDNSLIPTLEIKEYKTAGSGISSVWTDNNFYTTKGSGEIRELFASKAFSYPKPLALVRYILKRTTKDDDLIVDFFSGSATTAHAVMQLNAEDEGRRKFIMVQLPEQCDEQSEAYKAGYRTICDIGKERIRRAGDKIKADSPLTTQNLDTGFRVFKLDETNMTDVYYSADEYNQGMLSMLESNVKADRTDLDLLFGCLLEWGLPLSLPYISEQLEGCTVHTYNEGDLIACFDENIPDSVIKEIARRQPLRAVFRDSSFASSPSKINVGEIFKMLAPDTRVKVI
jgi:adenine-specific DNA-methyltransferase